MVRIPRFHRGGPGSIPGQGTIFLIFLKKVSKSLNFMSDEQLEVVAHFCNLATQELGLLNEWPVGTTTYGCLMSIERPV